MKEIIRLGTTLLVISLLAAVVLGFTQELTAPTIAENRLKKEKQIQLEVMPLADKFEQLEIEADTVVSLDNGVTIKISSVYKALKDGELTGYVVKSISNGYGGELEVLSGLTVEGKVLGVRMTTHQETPGLGANATKPDFYQQYNDKIAENLDVNKVKASETEVQAITGATITSKAVTNAVQAAGQFVADAENLGGQ